MSATELYVKACRCLYSNETCDQSSWNELLLYLPQLRASLSCRVCRGLIVDPQSSGYCQHYVCRDCLKKKRALNPGCKWCLDWNKLQQSDRKVRVVLACYKLLCETIQTSDFYNNMAKDATVENLLGEAISNPDVLTESSFACRTSDSNVSKDRGKSRSWTAAATSRDLGKIRARENVAKNVNKGDGGTRVAQLRKKLKYSSATSSNSTLKPKDNSDHYSEQCNENLNSSKPTRKVKKGKCEEVEQRNTNKHKCSELESHILKGEINNNEMQQDFTNNTSKFDKVESRSRNGKVRQICEEGRHMKKRKFRHIMGTGTDFENDNISLRRPVDQYWKCRPKKRRKVDLGIYNKKSISLQQTI